MIEGLSNIRIFKRVGKIHLGEKAVSEKSDNEYAKATPYFVCPDEVKEIYGETPDELEIFFPGEDPDTFCPQYYKRYGGGGVLLCKGTGKEATSYIDQKRIPCPCELLSTKKCKAVCNLFIILPKVNRFGVYQIDTSSINSMIQINSMVAKIQNEYGKISGIPLILKLIPKTVFPKGIKKVVYTLDIDIPSISKEEEEKYKKEAVLQKESKVEIETPAEIEEDLYSPSDLSDIPSEEGIKQGFSVPSLESAVCTIKEQPDLFDSRFNQDIAATPASSTEEDPLLPIKETKRMWMSVKRFFTQKQFKDYLFIKYKVLSMKDITVSQAEDIEMILAAIESGFVTAEQVIEQEKYKAEH